MHALALFLAAAFGASAPQGDAPADRLRYDVTEIDLESSAAVELVDINDALQVVGTVRDERCPKGCAFVRQPDGELFVVLGLPGLGRVPTEAVAINDDGYVALTVHVQTSYISGSVAVMWNPATGRWRGDCRCWEDPTVDPVKECHSKAVAMSGWVAKGPSDWPDLLIEAECVLQDVPPPHDIDRVSYVLTSSPVVAWGISNWAPLEYAWSDIAADVPDPDDNELGTGAVVRRDRHGFLEVAEIAAHGDTIDVGDDIVVSKVSVPFDATGWATVSDGSRRIFLWDTDNSDGGFPNPTVGELRHLDPPPRVPPNVPVLIDDDLTLVVDQWLWTDATGFLRLADLTGRRDLEGLRGVAISRSGAILAVVERRGATRYAIMTRRPPGEIRPVLPRPIDAPAPWPAFPSRSSAPRVP